jgi:hypothetical protein
LIFQNIDRHNIPYDIAKISVELPVVKDERDAAYVNMEANKAILELRRNGGGKPPFADLFRGNAGEKSCGDFQLRLGGGGYSGNSCGS